MALKFVTRFVLFTMFITNAVFSQKSIHQIEYENHLSLKKEKSFYDESSKDIIPLKYAKTNLSAAVYGYLPDWEYLTARYNLNYDLLTHISAFDFEVASDGSISNPAYWPWTDVINAAHAKGVKVILTAVNFKSDQIHNLLTNLSAKQNFFNNVIAKINTYKLDGVNIDFEGMTTADRGSLINGFMTELTNLVHTQLPGKEVSCAGPAVNWGGWDLSGLANACDYIFIMGYDFYGSWSTASGAVSPLTPNTGSSICVKNTIEVQYASVTNSIPNKLILGIPYYGQKWNTFDISAHSSVKKYMNSTRFRDDYSLSISYGLLWATDTQTPWYRYYENGEWYQVWFDNDSSLGLKYQLAQSKKLKGVGMWALGYDGSRQELWNELRKRFYIQSGIEEGKKTATQFELFQNYPNPFNPSTVIEYSIPSPGYVSVKVFDLLGKEIAVLVSSYQNAGKFSIRWSPDNLSGGIYFLRMNSGTFSETRKMFFIK